MLSNFKNMFKSSGKGKSKAEKPVAKNEKKGGFNLLGLLNSGGSKPKPTVNPQNTGSGEYFLSADDAKTFGDIDYMRTKKAVRKSFPKMQGSEEGAEIEVVASNLVLEETSVETKPATSASSASSFQESSFTPSNRAKVDTNLDMFRNMAKGIKKR